MMKYICLALFLVHDSSVVESFTPAGGRRRPTAITTTTIYSTLSSPNNAGSRFFRGDLMDDGHLILNQAREIAFGSDEVLALDAPLLLNKLLELESDCSSGKRLGEDVCDLTNYDGEDGSLVEIVAQLRVKAAAADAIRHKLMLHNLGLFVAMASAIMASTFVWNMHQSASLPDTAPLTAQELVWAVRDGYLGTFVMHWLRHGGL